MPMYGGKATNVTLPDWFHQTYHWESSTNNAFKGTALMGGITGGYSANSGTGQNENLLKQLKDGQCGYLTFVPIIQQTCGTYTKAEYQKIHGKSSCESPRTISNACVEQPKRVVHPNDGYTDWETIRGVMVFVNVDCSTFDPLPDAQQDPVFNLPNVRLPRDDPLMKAYKDFWTRSIDGPDAEIADLPTCTNNLIDRTDCLEATAQLLPRGANVVDVSNGAKKGSETRLSLSGNCGVWVAYNEDWMSDCKVSFLEVAAALQAILDSCAGDGGEEVGGWQALRDDGDCSSTVSFQPSDFKGN